MKITEILKGCEPGKIQSVGYMQIVPLISKYVDESIYPPQLKVSSPEYGTLVITNDSVNDILLPTGSAIISKQFAQDHATHKGAFVKKKSKFTDNNASCIQDRQAGHINNDTDYHLSILPWAMREHVFNTRNHNNFDKLWPVLRQFNSNLGITMNTGYLTSYLEKFEDDMNQFIAEFEIVPDMVGAIIMINGMVVGVERCPNHNYWKYMWKPLIRESYAGAVFQYIIQSKEFKKIPKPITRVPMSNSKIKNIDDLEKEFDRVTTDEDKIISQIISSFLKLTFTVVPEQETKETKLSSVKNSQFIGHVFEKNNAILYCSLITTLKYLTNPVSRSKIAPDWDDAKEFSM